MTDYPTGDNESAMHPEGLDPVVGEGLDNPNHLGPQIKEAIENMVNAGDDERREGELYKEIAAKPDLVSRLRFVNNKYNEILLAAIQVMEEVDGITFDQEKFDGIEMLSAMVREATQFYDRTEGYQGSVDKAYQLIADKMRDILHYNI